MLIRRLYLALVALAGLLALIEAIAFRFQGRRYNWWAWAGSVLLYAGQFGSMFLFSYWWAPLIGFLRFKYPFHPPEHIHTVGGALALFLCFEFIQYWMHRCDHYCRWMWATHSVHHSAKSLVIDVSYRQGWTEAISGIWFFWMPLDWLGFHPDDITVMFILNGMYDMFLHTELVGKLGPLEWIFNTPSHHRVHHAMAERYLNRNFGGCLIIWDRLFGTFAAEAPEEPCVYGIVGRKYVSNVLILPFREWFYLFRDVFRARGSWTEMWLCAFGSPGRVSVAPTVRPKGWKSRVLHQKKRAGSLAA
jgi:sterol desaturase/sphingolipid hydroxylase (fatty acid hydroxylase superfamily)